MKTEVVFFILLISTILCKEPAVKVTINNHGIDFIKNVSRKIKNLK
jgi:hypothetical protein